MTTLDVKLVMVDSTFLSFYRLLPLYTLGLEVEASTGCALEFCEGCKDNLIRDRIIIGLNDNDLINSLVKKPGETTFAKEHMTNGSTTFLHFLKVIRKNVKIGYLT